MAEDVTFQAKKNPPRSVCMVYFFLAGSRSCACFGFSEGLATELR